MQHEREVGWKEVMERVKAITPARGTIYGVPRGGAVVAGLMKASNPVLELVGVPQFADVVVDDVVDSGKTRGRFRTQLADHEFEFRAMFDKTGPDSLEPWLRFPWEHVDPTRDIEDTVIRQLRMVDEDPAREGLRRTPQRFLRALEVLTSGMKADPLKPLKKQINVGSLGLVVLRAVPFVSLCEQSLMPFMGTVDFAYLPAKLVVGLDRIPRFIEILSKRLQVQERLTQEIVDIFFEEVKPRGVMASVRAHHVRLREGPGVMVTHAMRGSFDDDGCAIALLGAWSR